MAEKQQQGFGALGTVLAKDLSAIEDLPNYVAPPPGVYKLLIEACKPKVINEKQVIAVDYVFIENISLNDPEADKQELEELKVQWGKDKMSELFYFDDAEKIETTLGVLKKKYGGFGNVLGTTNLMEILEKMPNMTVSGTIGRRVDEKDKSKFHPYTRTLVPMA